MARSYKAEQKQLLPRDVRLPRNCDSSLDNQAAQFPVVLRIAPLRAGYNC